MGKKSLLYLLLILFIFGLLVSNVECWSRRNRQRSQSKKNNIKGTTRKHRRRYRFDKIKGNKPEGEGPQVDENGNIIENNDGTAPNPGGNPNQPPQPNNGQVPNEGASGDDSEMSELEERQRDLDQLKQIEDELTQPMDQQEGISLKDKQRFDQELADFDIRIQAEQDPQKQQTLLQQKGQRVTEINRIKQRIVQRIKHLQDLRLNIIEELAFDRDNDSQNKKFDKPENITIAELEQQLQQDRKEAENIKLAQKQAKKPEDVVKDEDMTKWLDDWEKYMKDFKADEMLSFEVGARGFEVFFEDINKPCHIRGAYFINFDSKEGLDLKILDPKNKDVFKSFGKRQGIFSFNVTEVGTYSFFFQNRRSGEKKTVSFVVDVSDNETHLKPEHVDSVKDTAQRIKQTIRNQLSEFKILRRKDRTIDQQRKSNASKILWFSILETLVIVGCTVFQVMYIKKILDNRSFV